MEDLECRTNWTKVVLPTVAPIFLLLNLSIVAKYVSSIIRPFLTATQSASEAVELRTISAMVDHAEASEEDQPQNTDESDSYSVGLMAGVLTILAISVGKVSTWMSLHLKAGNLMFLLVELILSILIPLLWFVSNTAIIRTRFAGP